MGVRLGRAVGRLEARAVMRAESAAEAETSYVISYSGDNVRVDRRRLGPGESVAMDVFVAGAGTVRTVERVTTEPDDLGFVYGVEGDVVGRVVEVDGPIFSYCLCDDAGDDPLPGVADTSGVDDGQ